MWTSNVEPAPEYPYTAHRFQVLIGNGELAIVYYNLIGGKVVEYVTPDSHEYVFYTLPASLMGVAA